MNGVLDWTYEEPTHLIITPEKIDGIPGARWYDVRGDMSYPSGVGYINQDNLVWSTSTVAVYDYDESLIHVVGNGEAVITVTEPDTGLQGNVLVTGSGFPD